MARLAWGAHGEHFFETGIDRGVLYLPGKTGVPWNGLTAVSESPEGGEPRPYYADGYKYLNVAAAEEFKATLSAFTSPHEFGQCDGTIGIHNGLFATQQPRKPFNLSYRTMVGNDIQGADHGYKIHLVYNALAAPSTRENKSMGDSVSPTALSWDITTTPPRMDGLKPTAHFVIDSRLTPRGLLQAIEDILYGSNDGESRLLSVDELVELFNSAGPVVATNLFPYPNLKASTATLEVRRNLYYGTPGNILSTRLDDVSFDGDLWYQYTSTASPGGMRAFVGGGSGLTDGATYAFSAEVANPSSEPITLSRISMGDVNLTTVVLAPGERRVLRVNTFRATWPSGYSFMDVRGPAGTVFLIRLITIETGPLTNQAPFNGHEHLVPDPDLSVAWTGAVDNSPSILKGYRVTGLIFNGTVAPISSTQWSGEDSQSMRMIPMWSYPGSGYLDLMAVDSGLERGKTYTAMALVRKEVDSLPSRGSLTYTAADIDSRVSESASPMAGVYLLRIVFTPAATGYGYLRVYHNGQIGEPDIWVDDIAVVEGIYTGPFFSGDSTREGHLFEWVGVANKSPSTDKTWY